MAIHLGNEDFVPYDPKRRPPPHRRGCYASAILRWLGFYLLILVAGVIGFTVVTEARGIPWHWPHLAGYLPGFAAAVVLGAAHHWLMHHAGRKKR